MWAVFRWLIQTQGDISVSAALAGEGAAPGIRMLASQDFQWKKAYQCGGEGEEDGGERRGRARARPPLCPIYSQPKDNELIPLYSDIKTNKPKNQNKVSTGSNPRDSRKALADRSNLSNTKKQQSKHRSISEYRLDPYKQSNQTGWTGVPQDKVSL